MIQSIEEQRTFLAGKFYVQMLRDKAENRENIRSFKQALQGDKIANYLIEDAWEEDCNHDTRVFLVRDKETDDIAFYYSINCGILYKEIGDINLDENEVEVYSEYLSAILRAHDRNLSKEDQIRANDDVATALGKFATVIHDSDRITALINLAENQAMETEEKQEAIIQTREEECAFSVKETFPAIDIKFLCRNGDYKVGIHLDFKMGVFVFWEIIVPHILDISNMLGCKFVYLFAADNTEKKESVNYWPKFYSKDYDPDDDEIIEEEEIVSKKLVNYYIHEFKFKPLAGYKVLKPHYERNCYTLFQEVSELEKNRKAIWDIHTKEMEPGSYK